MKMTFTIPGTPIPKQRHRRGKNAAWYSPRSTRDYEDKVRVCALQARIRPSGEPVTVTLRCFFPDHRRRDADNVAKSLLDGLNGVAWYDDAQVVRLVVEKHMDHENPRAEVEINLL